MPDDISPEDREQLVEMKFGQLLTKMVKSGQMDDALSERLTHLRQMIASQPHQPARDSQPMPTNNPERPARKRNLLEECFSNAFGWP